MREEHLRGLNTASNRTPSSLSLIHKSIFPQVVTRFRIRGDKIIIRAKVCARKVVSPFSSDGTKIAFGDNG